jgi:hypothetical protein
MEIERVLVRSRIVLALSAVAPLLASCGEVGGDAASGEEAASSKASYGFTLLAANGGAAPGGGTYVNDFEPGGLNNRGQFSYAADVSTGGEGVFLGRGSSIAQIIRSGDPAPGGGTFGPFGIFGHAALNDPGDLAFAFNGAPFTLPLGVNSGVYRFTAHSGATTAIVTPFVTPAPTGGMFQGSDIHASINNGGDVVFAGIIATTAGISVPPSTGLGVGVFRADRSGGLTSVAVPGDAAPGGCDFDFAQNPWINDAGDIAFGAHVACDECKQLGSTQDQRIFCAESVYFKPAPSGPIVSIAHQGDPAPGGGVFNVAFGPVLNSRGDILFIGDLGTSPDAITAAGVFLFSKGTLASVARPGDAMPGGGHLTSASPIIQSYDLNNGGDVTFAAALDTGPADAPDTGLYVRVGGVLRLVARTGTVIPGVGTVAGLVNSLGITFPSSGAIINNRGQVLFSALLTGGGNSTVLMLATPRG